MKKILFAMLFMLSLNNYAQTYTTDEKALTGVFECQGKTKAQIFSAISKWISINYISGKSDTQLSDSEGGNIVVKGINEITLQTNSNILYPKMKSLPKTTVMKFNHLIEINVKDNKFRIIFKIVDINYEPDVAALMTPELTKKVMDCINLNGVPDSAILTVSETMDLSLKGSGIGKEKIEQYLLTIKPMYDKINSNFASMMKETMMSINKSIEEPSDGW
jgi:hypothetical protein